jgi:hypothetical protein
VVCRKVLPILILVVRSVSQLIVNLKLVTKMRLSKQRLPNRLSNNLLNRHRKRLPNRPRIIKVYICKRKLKLISAILLSNLTRLFVFTKKLLSLSLIM